jgi:hypothetical protein
MNRGIGRFLAVVAALAMPHLAREAFAQGPRASVGVDAVSANHRLTGDVLRGGWLRFDVAISDDVATRFGAERVSGTSSRSGVACGGFVLRPELCPTEIVVDDGTLTTVAAGLGARVVARGRFALDLASDLRIGLISVESSGATTGNVIGATKLVAGADFGADASWLPWARLPIAFEVGATIGGLGPLVTGQTVDDYTPFEEGFRVTRVRIGIVWRP